jgi:hypothetical protein
MISPTKDQVVCLQKLADAERKRRPLWITEADWDDIIQEALASCLRPSSRHRQPIGRKEPPPAHARYLQAKGEAWNPVLYFWKERLKEARRAFKQQRDLEASKNKPLEFEDRNGESQEIPLLARENTEQAVEAMITADEIYSPLSPEERILADLMSEDLSMREIGRQTGISMGRIIKVRRVIRDAIGAPRPETSSPFEEDFSRLIVGPPTGFAEQPTPLTKRKAPRLPRLPRPSLRPTATPQQAAEVKAAPVSIDARTAAIEALRTQLAPLLPYDTSNMELGKIARELGKRGELPQWYAAAERSLESYVQPNPTLPPRVQRSKTRDTSASRRTRPLVPRDYVKSDRLLHPRANRPSIGRI